MLPDEDVGREILVDARWLEPPEPMERVLAAMQRAAHGERIRFLIHREPFPLYPLLQQDGWTHRTQPMSDGSYEVLIERDTPA